MEPVRFEQEKTAIFPSQLRVCVRRPAVIEQGEHKMPTVTPPTAHLNNKLLVFYYNLQSFPTSRAAILQPQTKAELTGPT